MWNKKETKKNCMALKFFPLCYTLLMWYLICAMKCSILAGFLFA